MALFSIARREAILSIYLRNERWRINESFISTAFQKSAVRYFIGIVFANRCIEHDSGYNIFLLITEYFRKLIQIISALR